jgi:hypothetical protein
MVTVAVTAQADKDYEEVGYDQLLKELHMQDHPVVAQEKDSFEDISFHLGFGMLNSVSNFRVDNRDIFHYQSGFQIALGIDLFVKDWTSEVALRNYGVRDNGTESTSLREFDLQVLNRDTWSNNWSRRVGMGLANRYLKYSDTRIGFSRSENTPSAVFLAGVEARVAPAFSIGIEASFRTAMIGDSIDRNSADMLLRFDGAF